MKTTDRRSHGLLYQAPLIRGLLDGSKTQTRRPVARYNSLVDGRGCSKEHWAELDFSKAWVDPGPSPAGNHGPYLHVPCSGPKFQHDGCWHRVYPRVAVGDEMWARETWAAPGAVARSDDPVKPGMRLVYRADTPLERQADFSWRSSMTMPRWAARIVRTVTKVVAERALDISEEDAKAEGVEPASACGHTGDDRHPECDPATYARGFRRVWRSIYGDKAEWCWGYHLSRENV